MVYNMIIHYNTSCIFNINHKKDHYKPIGSVPHTRVIEAKLNSLILL